MKRHLQDKWSDLTIFQKRQNHKIMQEFKT